MRCLLAFVCACQAGGKRRVAIHNGFREGLAMRLQTAQKTSIIAMEMIGVQTRAPAGSALNRHCMQGDKGELDGPVHIRQQRSQPPPSLFFPLLSRPLCPSTTLSLPLSYILTSHLNTEMPTLRLDPVAQACFDEVMVALGVEEGSVKTKAREVRSG